MKKKPWEYLRFHKLQMKIEAYGYHYSLSRYIRLLIFGIVILLVLGWISHLKLLSICILGIITVTILPFTILEQFHHLYAQQQFQQMVQYMEQMMYSFLKHSKIVSALEEVESMSEGKIKEQIAELRMALEGAKSFSYEESFQKMENYYGCRRLKEMHQFFRNVEELGGPYETALMAMLEDTKLWVERTYIFQKERKQMKKKILFSMICVLVLTSVLFAVLIRQKEMLVMADSMAYQTGTTIIYGCFLLLFFLSQKLLSGKWIQEGKQLSAEQIEKDWKHIKEEPESYPRAAKRLAREVEKQFPVWLRMVLLRLQTENVYQAIVESASEVPVVLRDPLQQLIEELKEDPVSIQPYDHFLKELPLPQVHSVMKMLYSYTNMGTEEAKNQLLAMMKRNTDLADHAERIENEDDVAKYWVLFYIPMFLGTAKIMLDLSMLFLVIFSLWGNLA